MAYFPAQFLNRRVIAMFHARILGTSNRHLLAAALYAVLASAHAQAPDEQPPATDRVATDAVRDPQLKNFPVPAYPDGQLPGGTEGWVVLSMMVDAKGKPYEVGVVRSTGILVFEQMAVQSMEQADFAPATANGTPVDSVFEFKFKFANKSFTLGARPGFIRTFKALQAAIAAKDRVAADAAMTGLKVTTLYEDAYYGLAQYDYAKVWGDERQLEKAL
jgi:TonB family protein